MRSLSPIKQPKTILVAEDDEFIGALVCQGLNDAGYRTHWVKDGVEALNYVLAAKPDGIVLDLVLPKLAGFEVCAMVRKSPSVNRTPIIVISGRVSREDKLRTFDLGADDYVTKPFSMDELVARVEAVIHRFVNQTYTASPFLTSTRP